MILDGKFFPYKKTVKKLYQTAGKVLKEDFDNVNVSINFVAEREIKNLNKTFRNIEKVTDVLSFPNLEKKPTQSLIDFEKEKNDEVLFLGDIVVCKKRAYQQAKEYNHRKKREICFLALHGLLHLLGYDHVDKADEKMMNETAEKILKEFGVNR